MAIFLSHQDFFPIITNNSTNLPSQPSLLSLAPSTELQVLRNPTLPSKCSSLLSSLPSWPPPSLPALATPAMALVTLPAPMVSTAAPSAALLMFSVLPTLTALLLLSSLPARSVSRTSAPAVVSELVAASFLFSDSLFSARHPSASKWW